MWIVLISVAVFVLLFIIFIVLPNRRKSRLAADKAKLLQLFEDPNQLDLLLCSPFIKRIDELLAEMTETTKVYVHTNTIVFEEYIETLFLNMKNIVDGNWRDVKLRATDILNFDECQEINLYLEDTIDDANENGLNLELVKQSEDAKSFITTFIGDLTEIRSQSSQSCSLDITKKRLGNCLRKYRRKYNEVKNTYTLFVTFFEGLRKISQEYRIDINGYTIDSKDSKGPADPKIYKDSNGSHNHTNRTNDTDKFLIPCEVAWKAVRDLVTQVSSEVNVLKNQTYGKNVLLLKTETFVHDLNDVIDLD